MQTLSMKTKTTLLIAVSFIVVLIMFPFQDTFWGGLVFAIFSAATIGGLADSFAISALFGQPLSIPWPKWMGTHIIARNRKRLIDEMANMVEHELFTVDMLKKQFQHYEFSQLIFSYFQDSNGNRQLKSLLKLLITSLASTADSKRIALGAKKIIAEQLDDLPIAELIADLIQWCQKQGYDEQVISFALKQLKQIISSYTFLSFTEQFLQATLKAYEGNKKGRQFVNGVAGLNSKQLSIKVQQICMKLLQDAISETDHPIRRKISSLLLDYSVQLKQNDKLKDRVTFMVRKGYVSIMEQDERKQWLASKIDQFISAISEEQEENKNNQLTKWFDQTVDDGLMFIGKQAKWNDSINNYIFSSIITFLKSNNAALGQLVRTKLGTFSEEELIELVKDKAGRDLQYIRLNGTLVGGLIGMLLYLLTFWIGG